MPDIAPAEDTDFMELAAQIAIGNFARAGLNPFGIVHTDDKTMIVPSEGFRNEVEKREFVNILRFISIEHSGQRSAFAMESWTMFSREPDDLALLDEIYARGGSMREHPKAGEAVFIVVESDAGFSTRLHRIVRDGAKVTLEAGEIEFDPRPAPPTPPVSRGLFSNFHVPTGFHSDPAAQAYAAQMRELVPSTLVRITPTEAPPAN
jgi:hypothetical protein